MQLNGLWLYCFRLKTLTGTLDESHDLNAESDRVSNIYYMWTLQLITLFFSVVCVHIYEFLHEWIHEDYLNTSNFFESHWLGKYSNLHLNENDSWKAWFATLLKKLYFVFRYLLSYFLHLCILTYVNYVQLAIIIKSFGEFEPGWSNLIRMYVIIALFTFCLSTMTIFSVTCISALTTAHSLSFTVHNFWCHFFLTFIVLTVSPSKLHSYSTLISFLLFVLAVLRPCINYRRRQMQEETNKKVACAKAMHDNCLLR